MTQPRTGLLLVLVLAATAGVFSTALDGDFVWDDKFLINGNARLRGPDAWRDALTAGFWDTDPPILGFPTYWRPAVKLSHVALWKLGSGSSFPFHLLNVALHLGTVTLIFLWLRRRLALREVEGEAAGLAALAGASLFSLHTTRFEAVPWISDSTDLMMAFFLLATVVTVRTRGWWLAPVLAALATFSKETALVLPALLLLDGLLSPEQKLSWRRLGAVTVGAAVPWLLRFALGIEFPNPPDHAGFVERLVRVVGSWGAFHIRLLPLTPTINPFDLRRAAATGAWQIPPWLLSVGVALALAWVALAAQRRNRRSLADLLWWLLPIAPVLQLKAVPLATFCPDRFQYLPLAGVCALLASGVAWSLTSRSHRAVAIGVVGLLSACGLQLALAVPAFESELALMRREFELHPDSPIVLTNYATALENTNNWRAALALRRHATEVPQVPLDADMCTIDLASTEATVLRDADVKELQTVLGFVDAILTGEAIPDLTLHGRTWPMHNRYNLRTVAKGLRRGGDLPWLRSNLQLRLGYLDEALANAQQNLNAPSPTRHIFYAQVLAVRGDWAGARAQAQKVVAEAPELRDGVLKTLLVAEDPTFRVPYDRQWSALRTAATLVTINAYAAARRELVSLEPSREVLRARVQVELLDRHFDGALQLLDDALRTNPGDEELQKGRADVLEIARNYAEQEREEIETWAPELTNLGRGSDEN